MDNLNDDLEYILDQTADLWYDIRNQQIFLTGGTGFFGKWLLSSFIYINKKLNLNNHLIVLSRDPEKFLKDNPTFSGQDSIQFVQGDIKSFDFPKEDIHYIIHAATEASVALNLEKPFLMYDIIVEGTKRILELAKYNNVKSVLHTSSGAVYGKQPYDITHVDENYNGSPDIYASNAAYGEGKRVAEMLASMYYAQYGVRSVIARCYAFIGPYLPLDGAFAAGNFINNIINNQGIIINGDGTPFRSYLYAADLIIWLWTILFKGDFCRPYNVGSDEQLTIKDLADLIASFKDNTIVTVTNPVTGDVKPQRYVPSIDRARSELGLKVNTSVKEAVQKTLNFYTF